MDFRNFFIPFVFVVKEPWIADVDNWTSGVRRLLSVCMEQSPGWSSWSRAVFWLSDVDSRLICLIHLVIYLLICPFDSCFCMHCICLWTASGFCDNLKKPNLIIIIYIIIIFSVSQSYFVRVTSKIQVNFRFYSCLRVLMIGSYGFS